MEPGSPYRPRVSRETRLLLVAGLIAVAALWLLARIRFPERPVTPNPVPSVLSQLAAAPKFDDLAREIAQLQARLEPSLLVLTAPSAGPGASTSAPATAAVRIRDDLAVALVPPGTAPDAWSNATLLARDAATGIAVVRLASAGAAAPPMPWTPRQPQQSRYFAATDVAAEVVALRPVFVGALDPIDSALWSEPVWAVPAAVPLAPGSFVFTGNAEFAGLVIALAGQPVIVPGSTVVAEAERLLATPPGPPGTLGIAVQDLTPPIASVTGAVLGVVVTWVDPDGPAQDRLMVGDVIEAIDGRMLPTSRHWEVRQARVAAGQTLGLRVRRGGGVRELSVVAAALAARAVERPLGLTLRVRSRLGAEVVRVEGGSAAERAGLSAGDVVTLAGDVPAPTPTQVTAAYDALEPGGRVLIAVTRGDAHFVTTLDR